MSNLTIIVYILAAVIPIGGILIAIGLFKGKIQQNAKAIETLASKEELAAAIQQLNKILDFMKERTEEDRKKGQEQWRESNSKIANHAERLSSLEAQQTTFANSLNEIRADFREMIKDIKEILRRLPQLPQ